MGKQGKSGNAAVNQEEPMLKPQANYLQYARGGGSGGDSFHKSRFDLKDS